LNPGHHAMYVRRKRTSLERTARTARVPPVPWPPRS
jgi:hypothetical protein